ncbi:hypothetical protein VNO78_11776 [Psophocarpus tetragonolobus]|uniref:Uncharacterized protein n=1 Tax=Psophocarpus tetragonolobus TaxID=3891 RepID=A0AAN9SPW7_PSOTE
MWGESGRRLGFPREFGRCPGFQAICTFADDFADTKGELLNGYFNVIKSNETRQSARDQKTELTQAGLN